MNKHISMDKIFIDIESSDKDDETACCIELAAVRYNANGYLQSAWSTKVTPTSPVNSEAAKINGYNEDDWRTAYSLKQALEAMRDTVLLPYRNGAFCVSYFMFDRNVLANQCKREGLVFPLANRPWINFADMTYPLVLSERIENRSLGTLAKYLEIPPWDAHNARDDAMALARCWTAFHRKFDFGLSMGSAAAQGIEKISGYVSKLFE
jgi:DNA polymerase III subunit alpha, Gram-positive type